MESSLKPQEVSMESTSKSQEVSMESTSKPQEVNIRTRRVVKRIVLTILIVIAIAQITATVILIFQIRTMNNDLKRITNDLVIRPTRSQMNDAVNNARSYDIKFIYDSLENTYKQNTVNETKITRLSTATFIEAISVTDTFTVDSAYFDSLGALHVDISTQPSFASNYAGNGNFTCTDRELKAELQELDELLINIKSTMINEQKDDPNTNTTYYTIKNYDLAKSTFGTLALRGE